MMKIRKDKIAWAAGLFEGEGSITLLKVLPRIRKDGSCKRPNGYKYLRLCMSLTDKDILEKFQNIVGGTIRGPYFRKNRKPIWYWQNSGEKGIKLIKLLSPYLGIRRKLKIKEILNKSHA